MDAAVDQVLDRLPVPRVPIKKQGQRDGNYVFGARVMRVQQDSQGNLHGNDFICK